MSTYFYVYPFGVNAPGDLAPVSTLPDGTLVSYSQAWDVNYQQDLTSVATAQPISRQQTNQMFYDITNNIQQYQTQGVPLWITASQNTTIANPSGVPYPYPIYARVAYNTGSPNVMQLWENQVANNTATPGSDNSWYVISGAPGVQPGTIIDFGGASAPAGYLACDGTTYLISQYPNLYAAIGLLWGNLPASGSFNVPDLRTYVSAGQGGSIPVIGGTAVGSKGGSLTYMQLPSDIASHTHPGSTAALNSFHTLNGTVGTARDYYVTPTSAPVITPTTLPLTINPSPTGSSQTSMNIVQNTALVLKCIKY